MPVGVEGDLLNSFLLVDVNCIEGGKRRSQSQIKPISLQLMNHVTLGDNFIHNLDLAYIMKLGESNYLTFTVNHCKIPVISPPGYS